MELFWGAHLGVTVAHGRVASQQGCHDILECHAVPRLGLPRDEAQGLTQIDMRKEKALPG